jgi:sugar lactone lactonase YvrE
METVPNVVIEAGCMLGEGPVWDHRTRTLFFVDILAHRVWSFDAVTQVQQQWNVGETVGFLALTPNPNLLVLGCRSGLTKLDLETGDLSALHAVEPDKPGNRINDGTVGPDGSLWFGTMDFNATEPSGRFWRWKAGALSAFGPMLPCTNGPAVTQDGQMLYCADTVGGVIFKAAISAGLPGELSPYVRFEPDWGLPDGVITDAEDHVWCCHWGGGRVTRFRPDGSIERVIAMPVSQVTKCAFGGPDLRTLYITTAHCGLVASAEPLAGHLFAIDAGVQGVPANVVQGLTL